MVGLGCGLDWGTRAQAGAILGGPRHKIIDDTALPEKGRNSVGGGAPIWRTCASARQFDHQLSKVLALEKCFVAGGYILKAEMAIDHGLDLILVDGTA